LGRINIWASLFSGFVSVFILSYASAQPGETSALAEGAWYKIAITEKGIYKIDFNTLNNWGISASGLNPNSIALYGNGGRVLPQSNSAERPVGLQSIAIEIVGGEDGSFDNNDYIIFYGQGPHHLDLQEDGFIDYEHHPYTDTSYYFLRTDATSGARVEEKSFVTGEFAEIDSYNALFAHEVDDRNILKSGRMWFGEGFIESGPKTFEIPISNILNEEATLNIQLLGQTYAPADMDIRMGDVNIGNVALSVLSESPYVDKGIVAFRLFNFKPAAGSNPDLGLYFNSAAGVSSWAYMDYFIFSGMAELKFENNPLFFRSLKSTENLQSTFKIGNGESNLKIWDITTESNPKSIRGELVTENGNLSFNDLTLSLNEYVVFDPENLNIPFSARAIANQDLYGLPPAELLIITPPSLLSEAKRLANHRIQNNGISVHVVTTHQIYNEFASGAQDVTAIRDFIRHIYLKGENILKNVLLFGKGTYDYKNLVPNNNNLVPLYASRNSVDPLDSYCSDDFYTFMDEGEGFWAENGVDDHDMDIGIGRLPVKSSEEANSVVNKLIRYDLEPATSGFWKKRSVFVADDGDGNSHMRDANNLADYVDTAAAEILPEKIYIDAYPQENLPNGQRAEEAKKALIDAIDNGSLVVNYSGHGSETRLAEETILDISAIEKLTNIDYLPLFVTATCEFGRHDDPNLISGAEYLINNENGGAIGIITSSRLVFQNTNFKLNSALYRHLFTRANGQYLDMGAIFKNTKNESVQNVRNRNFSFLGDPSMKLSSPDLEAVIKSETGYHSPGDTLRALEKVNLKGSVQNPDGSSNTVFSSTIKVTVLGQPMEYRTLGDEDQSNPATYYQRDNILFQGVVSVTNGEFDIQFVMPKNINYQTSPIKIVMYGYDPSNQLEVGGADMSLKIGAGATSAEGENEGPEIELFMNDTTFISGGFTANNATLIAKISDINGINLSREGFGQAVTAILDDSIEWEVSKYYNASVDDYRSGWLNFPIENLTEGIHEIRLVAYDVYNNSAEARINFEVVGNGSICVKKINGYPNPFTSSTSIIMEHNRAGEPLNYTIEIIDQTGQLIRKVNGEIERSAYQQILFEWDGRNLSGARVSHGTYLYRANISTGNSQSKMTLSGKLILMN
jgi:hypothetical protein